MFSCQPPEKNSGECPSEAIREYSRIMSREDPNICRCPYFKHKNTKDTIFLCVLSELLTMATSWRPRWSWLAPPAWRGRKCSGGNLFLWQGTGAGSGTAPLQPALLRPVCSPYTQTHNPNFLNITAFIIEPQIAWDRKVMPMDTLYKCEYVNSSKTRKALYKYRPFMIVTASCYSHLYVCPMCHFHFSAYLFLVK